MTMTHRWQVWRRFSERRSSHAAGRSTAKWFGTWLDWLLVPVFLLFFTTRLVPEPVADRSLYQSIAERMLAGDRLYGGVCGRGRNPTLRIWASDIPRLD